MICPKEKGLWPKPEPLSNNGRKRKRDQHSISGPTLKTAPHLPTMKAIVIDNIKIQPGRQPLHVDSLLEETLGNSCKKYFQHASAHSRYSALLEGEYERIEELGLEGDDRLKARKDARRLLKADESLEPRPISMAITVPPGVGKTTAMVRAFHEVNPGHTDLYMPTLKLCDDFCDEHGGVRELARAGADLDYHKVDKSKFGEEELAVQAEAESLKIPGGGYNCPKKFKSEILALAGASVSALLCARCTLKTSCGYYRQVRGLQETAEAGGMIVRPHARMWSGSLIERSRIVIVDEGIIDTSVKEITFPMSDMTAKEIAFSAGMGDPDVLAGAEDFERFVQRFSANPTLSLTDIIQDITKIKYLQRKLKSRAQVIQARLEANDKTSAELQDRIDDEKLVFVLNLEIACKQIILAWNAGLPMQTCKVHENKWLVFFYVHIPNLRKDDSLLVLDASYRPWFIEMLFPDRKFEQSEANFIDVDLNVEVHHIDITASLQSLSGTKEEKLAAKSKRGLLLKEIQKYAAPDTLLVSNKELMEAYEKDGLPPQWKAANFGALRGKNDWKDMSGVAIIGQSLPPVDVLERQAASYALLKGEKIYTVDDYYSAIGGRPSQKTLLPMDKMYRYFHPCQMTTDFIGVKVHDEYIQAVGRCRSVRKTEPQKIVIASKFMPTYLEKYLMYEGNRRSYENLSAWHKALVDHFNLHGFVLLSPSYLETVFGASKNTLRQGRKRSSTEDDVQLISYFAYQNSFSKGGTQRGYTDHVPPLAPLKTNDNKKVIHISDFSTAKGGTRLYKEYSYRDVPPLAPELKLVDVTWGMRGQPSTLIRDARLPWDIVEAHVPFIKVMANDELGGEVHGSRKFTVLTCQSEGAVATKGFSFNGRRFVEAFEYKAGTHFQCKEGEFTDFDAVSGLLSSLRGQNDSFVIRGSLKSGMFAGACLRTSRDRGDRKAFFEEKPRSWIMIDVDDFNIPFGLDWDEDGQGPIAETMVRSMPEPFRSTSCYVQASVSCGLKNKTKFKGHVWFLLDTPLTSEHVKNWLASYSDQVGKTTMYEFKNENVDTGCIIDMSVFKTVQPHFTANPIMIDCVDPMKERSWVIRGERDVVAVDVDRIRKMGRDAPRTYSMKTATHSDIGFNMALTEIGDGLRGFNEGVKNAARQAVLLINGGVISVDGAIEAVANAVEAADPGGRDPEEIDRYSSFDFIKDKIDWWMDVIKNEKID